jgi:hypothetical protein
VSSAWAERRRWLTVLEADVKKCRLRFPPKHVGSISYSASSKWVGSQLLYFEITDAHLNTALLLAWLTSSFLFITWTFNLSPIGISHDFRVPISDCGEFGRSHSYDRSQSLLINFYLENSRSLKRWDSSSWYIPSKKIVVPMLGSSPLPNMFRERLARSVEQMGLIPCAVWKSRLTTFLPLSTSRRSSLEICKVK